MPNTLKQVEPIQAIFFRDFKNSYIPEILDEIYAKRVYQPFLVGKKDLIIADWGGNQGLTSFYFKDFAKQVYTVEPSARHLEVLQTLVDFNKIKNITICPYAIANKNGKTKFYHNENTTMFSLKDTVNNKDDFEEVETVTPEEFFKRNNITRLDLLKWDTEGNEGEILVSEGFAKVASRINVIVGEYHDWSTMGKAMFAHTFEELGFKFNWLYNTHASVYTAVRK